MFSRVESVESPSCPIDHIATEEKFLLTRVMLSQQWEKIGRESGGVEQSQSRKLIISHGGVNLLFQPCSSLSQDPLQIGTLEI